MKIYVDFDDCLCETARAFSALAANMFGRNVPYENIRTFELDRSFGLNEEQYEQFMIRGHQPEALLALEETPGASSVINEWISRGYEVSIITGRPLSAYEPSRKWLDNHGLESVRAFKFFDHLPDLRVLVMDRPWNRDCEFPNGNYTRCFDWESIRSIVSGSV